LIGNVQGAGIFHENEISAHALVLDGAGLHIPGDPQMAGVGLGAHPLQFLDGDVIALVRLYPGNSEINDRSENYDDGDTHTRTLIFALHGCIHSTAVFRSGCPFSRKICRFGTPE